jgi:hypothetical protein
MMVLNVNASSQEKSDDSRDSFYDELEQVFHHSPKNRLVSQELCSIE